jgi:hypothetical protein
LKGDIKTKRSGEQGYGKQAQKAVAEYNIGKSIEIWRFATREERTIRVTFRSRRAKFIVCNMRMQACPVFTLNERKDPRVFAAIPITTKNGEDQERRFAAYYDGHTTVPLVKNPT